MRYAAGVFLLVLVLVAPAFHRWHHAHDDEGPAANFGHCFAVWDVVCGTARRASAPPRRLGFAGDDRIVDHVVGHQLWPLVQRAPQRSAQQRKPVE